MNDADPALFKKHSTLQSYHVEATGFTYPAIRALYRDHPQADKLPKEPSTLPLLVYIHGLGGSASQFGPLLTLVINLGPSLCIDLPGCGASHLSPTDWEAYTQRALTELLKVVIEKHRDAANGQKVVLIGHSMGCSLSARLASDPVVTSWLGGVIALCPRITSPTPAQTANLRRLLMVPRPIFNLFRAWDQRGGLESASVKRFVGPEADLETRKLQLKFNQNSRTNTLVRMTRGLITRNVDGKLDGLADMSIWARISSPVLLIAGESDHLNPPSEAHDLARELRRAWGNADKSADTKGDTSGQDLQQARSVKTVILPKPAAHSLLFASQQCRIVSGLVQAFLSDHVDARLSLGWQLHYLSKEGKWDVKNLAKWQKISPVSEPIGGVFRAMKTMREVDESHNPATFCRNWSSRIKAVVDISHEAPVYDPSKLEEGGIEYQKFPTVSKLPPKAEEVQGFNDLIDRLRGSSSRQGIVGGPLIAVHCHYGFNRTGFFIVCYLVERMDWRLQDAIDEFEVKRAPGIKHGFFVDELSVRYCSGLNRSSTL